MMVEILSFLGDLVIAGTLILVTAIMHAIALDRIMYRVNRKIQKTGTAPSHVFKIRLAVFCILGIFFLVSVYIWLWAFAYEALGIAELKTLEDAVYFSTVTFTTLGYGDIVLKDSWRVLSGIEAANGVILLGWSTAFLFEVMQLLYPRQR